jgi:hypothetical protein
MSVKIFTVFHKVLDERLVWAEFPADEIDRYFTPYAVNVEKPGKRIVGLDGHATEVGGTSPSPRVMAEYDLGWHDPALQARGFLETSCYVHVMRNRLYEPFDFVGVTQYDMRWSAPAAAMLRGLAEGGATAGRTAFGIVCGPLVDAQGQFHPLAFEQALDWNFLLFSYNKFFDRAWDIEALVGKPLTLFQTYVLPQAEFAALAGWLEVLCAEVYPWANEPPNATHWGALSGYTERAEALFMALRLHEGKVELQHLPLEHDAGIPAALGVTKDHYGAKP